MSDRQGDGRRAEALAEAFLVARGLRAVTRNYRCRLGEIDLIMDDDGVLVFCEVRLRESEFFGGASGSITRVKQRRIIAAARHYLRARPEPVARFDVVLLESLEPPRIEWLSDAFTLD